MIGLFELSDLHNNGKYFVEHQIFARIVLEKWSLSFRQ